MNLLWIAFPMLLSAQANLQEITRALGAGDVATLMEYFDQSVEVALVDREDTYTRAQAGAALRRFFSANAPTSFNQVHQGTSRSNDSQYCIGDLQTDKGTYRVYIYMRVEGSRLLIQELRFDRG